MNEHGDEKQFLERVRGLLDESAEALNPKETLRLRQIRSLALEAAEKKRFYFFDLPRWITVGGLATVATAVLAVFFWLQVPPTDIPAKQVEDFEILTSREYIDFYKDLEFLRWLETKEDGV